MFANTVRRSSCRIVVGPGSGVLWLCPAIRIVKFHDVLSKLVIKLRRLSPCRSLILTKL